LKTSEFSHAVGLINTPVNAGLQHVYYFGPLALKSTLHFLSIPLICFPSQQYRFYVEPHDLLLDEIDLRGHRIGDIHIPAFDIGFSVIENPSATLPKISPPSVTFINIM
jgi:hypothetical protein